MEAWRLAGQIDGDWWMEDFPEGSHDRRLEGSVDLETLDVIDFLWSTVHMCLLAPGFVRLICGPIICILVRRFQERVFFVVLVGVAALGINMVAGDAVDNGLSGLGICNVSCMFSSRSHAAM